MAAPVFSDEALKRLTSLAKKFGCAEIIPLRRPTTSPAQIQYLDLLPGKNREEGKLLPQAIAEFQGRPAIYFLEEAKHPFDRDAILDLQQRLANRGEHAVLAIARPGELILYPLNLDRKELLEGRWECIQASSDEAPFLFEGLVSGGKAVPGSMDKADPVFSEIHRLMLESSRALAGEHGEGPLDGLTVLSMTGRALFFRFLIDRKIVCKEDLIHICPSIRNGDINDVFSSAERAAQTSVWLDETFNGDLLPLVETIHKGTPSRERKRLYLLAYQQAGEATGDAVFMHLEAILRGYESLSRGTVQMTFSVDWDDLNFRHIPVGVLSQVYESFSHQWDSGAAKDNSVHYTPKTLAKLLVDQALAGLKEPHLAKVLDPACGAGVFLVLAFRELVKRRWEHEVKCHGDNAKRPGTKVIHQVLYEQLCGFDVSESALRLSALGLYITAIELNEIIRPPSALHAPKALKNSVLFNHAPKEVAERQRGFVQGSLSEDVDKRFDGIFDVVVGNPPWTRLKPKGSSAEIKDADRKRIAALNKQFTTVGKRVLNSSGLESEAKAYENPGGVPDVPFIWRSMEWVRPGGIIGLALEARLILTQSEVGKTARDSIFKALTVTGILNGSDLEQTRVWANMQMPWILFWARNEKPIAEEHSFHFLTPIRENDLCRKGEFRLDYQSAYTLTTNSIIDRGWLLKAMAMGTILDVQVQDKLAKAEVQGTIGTYWSMSNQGFTINPRRSGNAPQWLLDLPVFTPPEEMPSLGLLKLPTFKESFGVEAPQRSRIRDAYRRPLVLITERPGENRTMSKAHRVLDRDVCFSKSYYGYSCAGHPDPELSSALLHLIVHSNLFRHFCFIRSPRVGAGRRTIYKEDVDSFPFPDIESINGQDRTKALELADAIDRRGSTDWDAVDRFVCKMFNISAAEAEVVNETVEFNGPYQSTRQPAAEPATDLEISKFATCIEQSLQPFFKVVGQRVRAAAVPKTSERWVSPWRFVTVLPDGQSFEPTAAFIAKIMRFAGKTSASRIVMAIPGGGLVLGLLNQRRFWTRSRARLCALHLSRDHLEKNFPLPPINGA